MKGKLLSFQKRKIKNHLLTDLFCHSATSVIYNLKHLLMQLNVNLHMKLGYLIWLII